MTRIERIITDFLTNFALLVLISLRFLRVTSFGFSQYSNLTTQYTFSTFDYGRFTLNSSLLDLNSTIRN